MKLRTRLFLSISALITVALLGLLLGVTSVMQLARSQEQLIAYNFATIDQGEKMRRQLGDQLVLITAPHTDAAKLHASQQQFRKVLEEGLMNARDEATREGFRAIAERFARFVEVSAVAAEQDQRPMDDEAFSEALNATRNAMMELQRHALDSVSASERYTRERAVLVAGLQGLLALAVLLMRELYAGSRGLGGCGHGLGQSLVGQSGSLLRAGGRGLLAQVVGLARAEVALYHAARQFDFLRRRQQRVAADIVQVNLGDIGDVFKALAGRGFFGFFSLGTRLVFVFQLVFQHFFQQIKIVAHDVSPACALLIRTGPVRVWFPDTCSGLQACRVGGFQSAVLLGPRRYYPFRQFSALS